MKRRITLKIEGVEVIARVNVKSSASGMPLLRDEINEACDDLTERLVEAVAHMRFLGCGHTHKVRVS